MSTHEFMHMTPSSVCQEEHRCELKKKSKIPVLKLGDEEKERIRPQEVFTGRY